jgi:hypothetical protein
VGLDDESKAALCDFGRGPEQCVDSLNIRSDDFPALAVDHTTGHLAAVWTDTRIGTTGKYDVVVSESSDGGATWTDANGGGTVLTPAGTTTYSMPSVAITAPSGKVVVSTYRANPVLHTTAVGNGTFGYGYLVETSGTFGVYTNASDLQNYPSPQANAAQAGFLGDYSSIAAAPSGNVVFMTWSDTRNSNSLGPDEDIFLFSTAIP